MEGVEGRTENKITEFNSKLKKFADDVKGGVLMTLKDFEKKLIQRFQEVGAEFEKN